MFREEKDSIGIKLIPKNAYYGIFTARASENFKISNQYPEQIFIENIVKVKKACAYANLKTNSITELQYNAIKKTCNEIINGKFKNEFITDIIQGGAGTAFNMNVNEVIANRANEILGFELGTYTCINPNDHVNYGQSTNDVIPTAIKITLIKKIKNLLQAMNLLEKSYLKKSKEFKKIIKLGRTHLQDAVPMSLGDQINSFNSVLKRDKKRIENLIQDLLEINLGGTAIGTQINTKLNYVDIAIEELKKITKLNLKKSQDMIDTTRHVDTYVWLSSALKTYAINISKIANDLRLMTSGPLAGFGELKLPELQVGSSIMPGKINPVIPEVVNQVAFLVIGNDVTICKAAEAGQLELNVFGPIIIKSLFESLSLLTNATESLSKNVIDGIEVNEDRCSWMAETSSSLAIALSPYIGYELASVIAKKSVKEKRTISSIVNEMNLFESEDLKNILNLDKLSGINLKGN